jgi:hypothetical protein
MRAIKILGMAVMMTMVGTSVAFAKPATDKAPIAPLPKAALVADNVVVTPGQSAPVTNPQPTQAQAVQPVAVEPVDTTPRRSTVVHEEPNKNYMGTIAVSALMGGVAGALVGGAIYYLGDQDNAQNIAYWAAGGVLVGTGVGLVQVMTQETRISNATAMHLPTDPAPTYRLALMRVAF